MQNIIAVPERAHVGGGTFALNLLSRTGLVATMLPDEVFSQFCGVFLLEI
jgi:hypothetical protein